MIYAAIRGIVRNGMKISTLGAKLSYVYFYLQLSLQQCVQSHVHITLSHAKRTVQKGILVGRQEIAPEPQHPVLDNAN
jgi:hypothetical protein